MREVDRGAEVVGGVALVGIDEDEIERLAPVGPERRETLECRAHPHLDLAIESCACEVPARHLGVALLELEADQATVVGQGAAQPDGAVPAERTDLEDPPGMDRSGEHVKKLPLSS